MDEQRAQLTINIQRQHCSNLMAQIVGLEVEINVRDRLIEELQKEITEVRTLLSAHISDSEMAE